MIKTYTSLQSTCHEHAYIWTDKKNCLKLITRQKHWIEDKTKFTTERQYNVIYHFKTMYWFFLNQGSYSKRLDEYVYFVLFWEQNVISCMTDCSIRHVFYFFLKLIREQI